MEAFGNDNFFNLLGLAKHKAAEGYIRSIAEGILGSFGELEVLQTLPGPISEAGSRIVRACRCIVALMDPSPGHLGSSPSDVTEISAYRGAMALESTLKTTFMKVQSWTTRLDDFVATAASTKQHSPTMQMLIKRFKDDPVEGHPQQIDDAIKFLPKLRKGLRQGATKDLEDRTQTLLCFWVYVCGYASDTRHELTCVVMA